MSGNNAGKLFEISCDPEKTEFSGKGLQLLSRMEKRLGCGRAIQPFFCFGLVFSGIFVYLQLF